MLVIFREKKGISLFYGAFMIRLQLRGREKHVNNQTFTFLNLAISQESSKPG